jgi:hypothetical protein
MMGCCAPLGFFPGSPPAQLRGIHDGTLGVKQTLNAMRQYVRQYKTNPGIRTLSLQLTRHVPSYDKVGEVAALHGFVRDQIAYREDVEGVETLQTPVYTLQMTSGDCDDKATLLCTMLCCIGYQCLFYAIGQNGGPFEHVMAGVRLGTRNIPLETIIPPGTLGPGSGEMGWMPPDAQPILPWNI